jgi:hypothetical protein
VEIGGLRLVQRFQCYGRESGLLLSAAMMPSNRSRLLVDQRKCGIELMNRYQASLPDELDLRPGMKLKVLRLYDDAWGTAQIVSGAQEGERLEGSFPIVSTHH